ncbi:unnamed protein product [Schistosoma rodhaini]|uniref:Cadherin domain-containing protein n=1 Tax=Schistosoma rodhaini TaxID=6188 RepID=A0AA85FZ53_9TREM|nr:unnamed protein product [Schistosoma rodhaini]
MELWRQNAKIYIFYFLFIINSILIYQVFGSCFQSSGSISITYDIIEESNIPLIIGNLKKDLCIDQYSNEDFISFNKPNINQHEFIIFPTSQPYYKYFILKTETIATTNLNEQYLILNQSIDRELLCNKTNDVTNSHSNSNENFYSNTYIQQYYNENNNILCNCYDLLGWCNIYLHLALIPLHNNNRTYSSNMSLFSNIQQSTLLTKSTTDYWLNSISSMKFFIIELKIIDINDNIPIFNPSNYKIIISESDKPGINYRLPIAYDQDLGINSLIHYNITLIHAINNQDHTIELFSINNTNNNNNNNNQFILIQDHHQNNHPDKQSINQYNKNQLYIQLIDSLDRELYHQYYIQIIAMDQSINHQKTGTLTLYIKIADINDQLPIFEYNQYLFHLIENSPKGTLIGQVKANDIDDGINSMIKYNIKEIKPIINNNNNYNYDYYYNDNNNNNNNQLINIDPITGEIKLINIIDREKLLKLFLIIEAKDNGQPSKSTITNVIIEIDDINDNNPIIDIWGYKEVLNSTGLIMTTPTSTTNIQHSSLIPFYLISSENSFIPIHIWVSELLNIRSILSIVKVNDLDQGINGTVQCSLNDSYFILQPEMVNNNNNNNNQMKSYYIILSKSLDYELQIIHHLPILCYDLGIPIARTSTVLLNIHIKDENDNEPKFLIPEIFIPAQWINKAQFINHYQDNNDNNNNNMNSIFDFHQNLLNLMLTPLEILIPETCPINTVILKFPVLDIDSGINSMLNYELRSINQYLLNSLNLNESMEINNIIDFIRINYTTGEIIIYQSLKLIPEYYKYIYEVIVKDQGIPSKVSRLQFSLQILIVNSFPPEVKLLKPNHLNRTIIELHKSKSNKKYEIEMYENEPAGTHIARIIGYDPDRGEAGRITFILIQNLIKTCIGSYKKIDDAISIDSNNGLITTLRPLDRELDGNLLLLTLHIQDHGIPIYTTTIHIHIKILDINDNPPIFLLPLYSCHSSNRLRNSDHQKHDRSSCHSLNIYPTPNITNQLYNMTIVLPKQSNHDLLHSFIQFQTIDYDLGINSMITYHLDHNCSQLNVFNDHSLNYLFIIDQLSGCLSIISKFFYEKLYTTYKLCIIAKDHGQFIQHYSILKLLIKIQLHNHNHNQSIIFINYSIQSINYLMKNQLINNLSIINNIQINKSILQLNYMDQQQHNNNNNNNNKMTIIIRILLCITTIISGLMIIMISIISIKKQPNWLLCNILCKKNTKETAKIELLRFHEVHNQIEVKRNPKYKQNEMKSYDMELEKSQNDPLLRNSNNNNNTDTLKTDINLTQTQCQQPVQIHLPQDYCIKCNNYSVNISDSLLNYYPYTSCNHQYQDHDPPPPPHHHHLDHDHHHDGQYEHDRHNSDSPVFLHIIRTCDIVNDPKLMKPIIETTTTGHIV